MNNKAERTMTDFTKETGQELSFKELFYDEVDIVERIISEAENIQKVSEIQEQIDSKNNEMNTAFKENNSKGWKIAAVTAGVLALFGVSSVILLSPPLFIGGVVLSVLLGLIPAVLVDNSWEKEKASTLAELSKLRKQLAEAALGGKIIGNIEKIDKHWQSVYVIEDGKKQEYMIRLLKDNNGHDFIETKRIEMSNL